MENMSRLDFLGEFLGALGAESLRINKACEESIEGRAFFENDPLANYYEPDDDQGQDFIWHSKESAIPSHVACNIVALLNTNKLLDIDKLKVSRKELFTSYLDKYEALEYHQFETGWEEVLGLVVNMVDDGKETDIFFIHE